MADRAGAWRVGIYFVTGLVTSLLVALQLSVSGLPANAAGVYDPEQTATPWPTASPTSVPTRMSTPTWTPHEACEPGVICGSPRPARTPCTLCTQPPLPTITRTTTPRSRPLLQFKPLVQFGHPSADGVARYDQRLLNRFSTDATVDLEDASDNHWPLTIRPEQFVAHPGLLSTVSIDVTVPPSHVSSIDVEQTTAMSGSPAHPVTATAQLITIANRHPFSDVPIDHWAGDEIQYLASQGIISGYADGSFRPDGNVTRAQFAKMLVGVMGWETHTPERPSFTDVSQNFWAYNYIETAAYHGAITGYSDGTFRPTAGVTRAQIAKIVVTARAWPVDNVSSESNFTDVSSDDWLYSYAQVVSAAEVMSGYSDGNFRPYSYATRGQVAKILALSLYSDPSN